MQMHQVSARNKNPRHLSGGSEFRKTEIMHACGSCCSCVRACVRDDRMDGTIAGPARSAAEILRALSLMYLSFGPGLRACRTCVRVRRSVVFPDRAWVGVFVPSFVRLATACTRFRPSGRPRGYTHSTYENGSASIRHATEGVRGHVTGSYRCVIVERSSDMLAKQQKKFVHVHRHM